MSGSLILDKIQKAIEKFREKKLTASHTPLFEIEVDGKIHTVSVDIRQGRNLYK